MATTGHESEPINVSGLKAALQEYKTEVSDKKVPSSLKGAANGIAELDSTGKVPQSQLPSFVDDVIELLTIATSAPSTCAKGDKYYNSSSKKIFTATAANTWSSTGETPEGGKIYVNLGNSKTYRWSGSDLVVISETLALGQTSSTAYRGDRGKIAYDHSQSTHARTDANNSTVSYDTTNKKITKTVNGTTSDVVTASTIVTDGGGITSHQDISGKQDKVAAKGSATKPLYTSAAGTFAECSTYAGGTAVTLNGSSKAASTASMYAPTSAGTAGQVLQSSGGAPAWKTGELVHYVTSPSGTAGSTASGSYNRTQWTGTCDGVTALYTGLTVTIKIPVAGVSRGVSLNINSLGEHPVVYGTGMLTSHYPVGAMVTLTYDADKTLSIYVNNTNTSFTGCWICEADYDSTNVYQLRHNYNTVVCTTAMGRYMILLQKTETNFVPVNAVDNNTGTSKTLTTDSFNPFGDILYYSGTTAVAANGSPSASALFRQNLVDLRYAFNTGTTLSDKKDVYIVAVPQPDGSAKLYSTPISQTLPTSEDGLIYIKLGRSYSTYYVELFPEHPVFWFKDGRIQLYTSSTENLVDILPTDSRFNAYSKVSDTHVGLWEVRFPATSSVTDHDDYKTVVIGAKTSSTNPCIWLRSIIDQYAGKEVTVSFWIKGTSASGNLDFNGSCVPSASKVTIAYTTSWQFVSVTFTVVAAQTNQLMLANTSTSSAISVDIKDMNIFVNKEDYRNVSYSNTAQQKRKLDLIMMSIFTSSKAEKCEFDYSVERGKKSWSTPRYIKNDNSVVKLSSAEPFSVSVAYYDKDFNGVITSSAVDSDSNNELLISLYLDYPYYRFYFQRKVSGTNVDIKPTIYIEGAGEELYATVQNLSSLKFSYDDNNHNTNFPKMTFASGTAESWSWLPLTIPVNATRPYSTENAEAVVQDSENIVYDYGWLALPATYSNVGKPTRLIIFCHGSSMHYTQGNETINTGRMGVDPSYWLSEGYAVMDMEGEPFEYESGTTKYPHDCTPQAWECYKAGYEFVVNTFNICKDGVFLGGRSLGCMMASNIVTHSGIPVLSVCLNAPGRVHELNGFVARNAARRAFDAYYKGFSPTGNLTDDATYWGASFLTQAQIDFITAHKDKFLKNCGYRRLLENFPAWTDYITLVNATQSSEANRTAMKNLFANTVGKTNVPIKIFYSPSDTTVNCEIGAELLYSMLSNGGCVCELRKFPAHDSQSDPYYGDASNTGHPFDLYVGNRAATFTNTRGIELLNVPIAYIEALQFWRRFENNLG